MNVRLWTILLAWALGAWAMTLVMSGTMAAIIFPTMKQLQPVLPEFVKAPDDHWSLAAGLVMRRVFFASDVVQLVLATACVVTVTVLLKHTAMNSRRIFLIAPVIVACIAMLTSAFWLSPAMRRDMDRAIVAGRDGNGIAMQEARAKFNSKHPIATGLMATTFSAVMLAMTATVVLLGTGREASRE